MRVKNSIINVSTGIGSQVIITLLSFISRSVFISSLGVEYLGINGLFTNVLGMLSLAEAGIGSSIIYSLYKPVADHNVEKINILMRLYKKAYMGIGLFIFLLGLSLMPFLPYFIKNSSVPNLNLIYMIFLINTVSSYFFAHKISFLNVCQKGYIVTGIYSFSSILTTLVKLGILYFTRNYILYLLIDIFITVTTSLILSFIVDRMYPFLKDKVAGKLDAETKGNIIKNIKALVLHNIGGYCVFGTDNMIISSFVSVAAVGLYSNYNMLINICRTFINQFFDNITHSIGNLVAQEHQDKVYSVFKVTMFCNFWIYSFFTIVLSITLEPFIRLWLGSQFIMSKGLLIILMINFYVSGMRRSITLVKTTGGIFREDRYAPFFEALVNLGAGIVLVKYMGITGVFWGTLISTITVPFWIAPYLVYKKIFNKPVIDYYLRYLIYGVIGIVTFILTSFISHFLPPNNFLMWAAKSIVCVVVINLIYVGIFCRTNEFKYMCGIIKSIIGNIFLKLKFTRELVLTEESYPN